MTVRLQDFWIFCVDSIIEYVCVILNSLQSHIHSVISSIHLGLSGATSYEGIRMSAVAV